jgi:hypothetical protein
MLLFAGLGKMQLKKNQKEEKGKNVTGNRSRNHMVPCGVRLFECHGYGLQVSKYVVCVCIIPYHLFSFHGSIQDYKIHMDTEIIIFA